jgi:hypothetical protein
MIQSRDYWLIGCFLAAAGLLSSPVPAHASAEVKFDKDFLAGIVEKLPPLPFKKDGSYHGSLRSYRFLGIDPKTRCLMVSCQVEGEFRLPVPKTIPTRGPGGSDSADLWRSFKFDVKASINVEPGKEGIPRFRIDVNEVKRRELEGFGGALAKIMGKAFDEMVTQVAHGKAASMNNKLNADIQKRINAFKEYGVFRGIDYSPTSVVLHFDLTRWKSEGIAGYVLATGQLDAVPFYRWAHIRRADHIYTRSTIEPDRRIYVPQGIACYVFDHQVPGTVPLYRWRSQRDHFYTTAPNGEKVFRRGFKPEGIACYVYTEPKPGTVPLFRFIDPRTGLHFYTTHPHAEFAK